MNKKKYKINKYRDDMNIQNENLFNEFAYKEENPRQQQQTKKITLKHKNLLNSFEHIAFKKEPEPHPEEIEVSSIEIPVAVLLETSQTEIPVAVLIEEYTTPPPPTTTSPIKNVGILPGTEEPQLSKEQTEALNMFKSGKNIFITGPGGTGKTRLIQEFVKHAKEINKRCQVTALTGCASILLGENATTIHSWSGILLGKDEKQKILKKIIKSTSYQSWKTTDILVIDEISMMSQKIFELLNYIGKKLLNPNLPFGGIQIVFSGDFYQLGPIGENDNPESQNFCFESKEWIEVFPRENHIELKTIFRQTDPTYIKILSQVRKGYLDEENINILKQYVNRQDKPELLPILFPVKSRTNYINQIMFDKIQEPIQEFKMNTKYDNETYIHTGKLIPYEIYKKCMELTPIQKEKEIEKLSKNSNCETLIKLKKGAVVMCTANINLENGICNGSQGIILDFVGNKPRVKFENGLILTMPLNHWQSEEYPLLSVGQYPLCLCWALTIHKIQGTTLKKAQIDIGNTIFEDGQSYVALSRLQSLDGLFLTSFSPNKIRANDKVKEFYANLLAPFDKTRFATQEQVGF